MKSKANFKSHPIHPILVGFPITFYFSTVLFDSLALIYTDVEFAIVGKYVHIAGIISAVAAALPGLIDYIYTVPPKSSGKTRAAKHGIANTIVLLLFIIALFFKYDENASPYWLLLLELVGLGITFYAGWIGGTLVHRNLIGIDMRYAGAGKWKEEYISDTQGPYHVCDSNDLQVDQMKLVHVRGKRVVIGRTEQGYVAFSDFCTHRGASLADGTMICGTVQCPWHGSQFDVKTGEVKAGPAEKNIPTYRVQETNGKVLLEMD